MNPALVFDGTYLCHRAFHSTGGLEYQGVKTGVLYGFFRDLLSVQELFGTKKIVICFDGPYSLREAQFPGYKSSRRATHDDPETAACRAELYDSIEKLRLHYLPKAGFRNIWWVMGYEADDLMATATAEIVARGREVILIAADKDLLQLLSPAVSMWNPIKKQITTDVTFEQEWGISPSQWADVKAIAGCSTDDVDGVQGVGEKTAAKFLSGKLNPTSKAFEKITKANEIWRRNLPLVRLPFDGAPSFRLVNDEVTRESLTSVFNDLGFDSLLRVI